MRLEHWNFVASGKSDSTMHRLLTVPFALVLALAAVGGARAQASQDGDTAVLPVWNKASGKLEGVLVLEPSDAVGAQARISRRFGMNSLDATFDLQAGDSLALLCDRKSGIAGALGNLANNCLLAMLSGDVAGEGSKRASATAAFHRGSNWVGLTFGSSRDGLPAWLRPGTPASEKVNINDLTVFARKSLPGEGYVSIAGTVAKARLLSPADAEAYGLSLDRWSSKSVEIGGGFGSFGAASSARSSTRPARPAGNGSVQA